MPSNSRSEHTLSESQAQRHTLWLGIGVYSVLLVFAAHFYLERMATLDMAFQSFHILRTGSLQIQSGRFGAAATQVFPWLAQALGWPLRQVLITYSLGHILCYTALFTFVAGYLRQWRWGLVLLLLGTLMTTHTFYWLSEMPQGLAFLTALLAWVHAKGRPAHLRLWEYPLLIAACVTAFYFHPLVLYAFLFCALYFWLTPHASPDLKRFYALLALIFGACFVVKNFVLPLDWYDAMAMERSKAFVELWPQWFDLKSQHDFLRWLKADYYLLASVVVLNTSHFLWCRQWLLAALAVLAPMAFVFAVNVPHHHGAHQFYMENLYLPLALMAAVPFVFSVLPARLSAGRLWLPVAALATLGLWRIYQAHQPWAARIHWERRFLDQTAQLTHRKWILADSQVPMDTLLMTWGSAYEFLFLSALQHPDSARYLLIDENPERFDSVRTRPGLFLGEFKNYSFGQLPARYFRLTDSAEYRHWAEAEGTSGDE